MPCLWSDVPRAKDLRHATATEGQREVQMRIGGKGTTDNTTQGVADRSVSGVESKITYTSDLEWFGGRP